MHVPDMLRISDVILVSTKIHLEQKKDIYLIYNMIKERKRITTKESGLHNSPCGISRSASSVETYCLRAGVEVEVIKSLLLIGP